MAASTALPPRRRTLRPIRDAYGSTEVTAPPLPTTVACRGGSCALRTAGLPWAASAARGLRSGVGGGAGGRARVGGRGRRRLEDGEGEGCGGEGDERTREHAEGSTPAPGLSRRRNV